MVWICYLDIHWTDFNGEAVGIVPFLSLSTLHIQYCPAIPLVML
jgi:hypothetical protein